MTSFRSLLLGAAMALSGLGIAGSVLLPWYSVDLPGRSLTAAGVEVSGELWLLPLLGAAVLSAGIATVVRVGRVAQEWAGASAVVAGLLAVGLAIHAAYFVSVDVTIRDGGTSTLVPVTSETLPLAALSVAAGLSAAVVGFVVYRSARQRRYRL